MAKSFNLTAMINLQGPGNVKPVVSAIRRELGSIKTNIQLDIKSSAGKNINTVTQKLQQLSAAAVTATNNVSTLSAALSSLSSSMGSVGSVSSSAGASVSQVSKSVSSAGKSVETATTQMQDFGKQSGLAIRRFAAFSAVSGVIYNLVGAVSSAYSEFLVFNKEMVRLSQVTGQSLESLSGVANEITKLSTSLGVASSELIQVTSTLAQAGLSADDTKTALEALAKSALAPSFDNLSETVEGSIAAMRQFGLGAKDLEGALGSINAVAAAFAVESSDIITAIQRTGGVFASASKGVSTGSEALQEFIAIFTSVRATTRESAETIATGLRTIFTRIQRGGTIEALKEYGIVLTDLEGKFVGPYEAVRRLSEGLAGLDTRDLRFGKIVEELGGFRQIGKVIPLIQEFATAQAALGVAQRGSGSLAKDAALAQLGLGVQFMKTRESFVSLVREIGDSGTFKAIATISLATANAFISLASALKPLLPMLVALTAIKGASILTEFTGGFFSGAGGGGGGGSGGGSGGGGGGGGGGSRPTGTTNRGDSDTGGSEVDISGSLAEAAAATTSNTAALASNTTSMSVLTTSVNALAAIINTSGGSGSAPLNGGGFVRRFARGGVVPGSGSGDTVPAMLQPGEFVIRKNAVDTLGAGNLHKMNKSNGGNIRVGGYAGGGAVQKFKGGGKLYDRIEPVEFSSSHKTNAGNLKATDGDSLVVKVDPTKKLFEGISGKKYLTSSGKLLYPKEDDYNQTSSRLEGVDVFEMKASKAEKAEYPEGGPAAASNRIKGQQAKQLTIDTITKLGSNVIANAFMKTNKVDIYGRPMLKLDKLKKALLAGNDDGPLAKKSGTGRGQDILQMDKLNTRMKIMADANPKGFGNKNKNSWEQVIKDDYMYNYFPVGAPNRLDKNGKLRRRDEAKKSEKIHLRAITTIRRDADFIKQMKETEGRARLANGGMIQKFMAGGKAQRNVGYIDTDVLRDPANQAVVGPAMQGVNLTDVTAYKAYLSKLAASSRKEGSLAKLRTIAGMAGSGKSSLMLGGSQSADSDNAKLRQTKRFPILKPEDIKLASEVIDTTSTVTPEKLDEYLKASDKIYMLSTSTKEEQKELKSRRTSRDTTGVNAFGRKPGATSGAERDSGPLEAMLGSDIDASKLRTLGISSDKKLKRKENIEVEKKKIALLHGSLSPSTVGHESLKTAAMAMGVPLEDFLVLISSDEGITSSDSHSLRTAVFDQDFRVLAAQAAFKGSMVSKQTNKGFALPDVMEISQGASGQRRFVRPEKGSLGMMVAGEGKNIKKYTDKDYEPVQIPRTGGVSGTGAREAILDGNLAEMQKILSPDVFSLVSKHLPQLQNRSSILPRIVEHAKKRQAYSLADITKELDSLPQRIDSKKVAKDPEYAAMAAQVKDLRNRRDKINTRASFEPFSILRNLAKRYPETYGLQAETTLSQAVKESVLAQGTVAAKTRPTNPGGAEGAKPKTGLPATAAQISNMLQGSSMPEDSKLGEFSGGPITDDMVRRTWRAGYDGSMSKDKAASYGAVRDYFLQKFKANKEMQAAKLAKRIRKSTKVGLVGLLPFDHSEDRSPIDINGTDVTMYERGLDSQFAPQVEAMQARQAASVNEFAADIQMQAATGGLSSGQKMVYDFDQTLVTGADLFDSKGNIDIPGYSDLDKVEKALGGGTLTPLGVNLKQKLDAYPELLDNLRISTARPPNNKDLIAKRLAELGLNIPADKITGMNGADKSKNLADNETIVDDNIKTIERVRKSGKKGIEYASIKSGLSDQQSMATGQANIEGAVIEQAMALFGAPIIEGARATRAIDYPNGLGAAASYFPGIGRDWPTEVKRTIDSDSRSQAIDEFTRYLFPEQVPVGKNLGGMIQRFAGGSKVEKLGQEAYGLIEKSGLENETSSIVQFANNAGYNLEEFKKYLTKRVEQKNSKAGIKTDPKALAESLKEPSFKTSTPAQLALAQKLKGFVDGGVAEEKKTKNYGQIALKDAGSRISASYLPGAARQGEVTADQRGSLYTVQSSSATGGYGPKLYDIVMEAASSKGSMLTSDRNRVSPAAFDVWKYYFKNRGDVNKTPLAPMDWYLGGEKSMFDPDKFASEDPTTWPPKTDDSWILQSGYTKSPLDINNPNMVQRLASGGEVSGSAFGTGAMNFPASVKEKYTSEQMKTIQRALTDPNTMQNERVVVDDKAVQDQFDQKPLDKSAFISSFTKQISRDSLFSDMANFAKAIGIPGESLTSILPELIDFEAPSKAEPNAFFDREAMGSFGVGATELAKFGWTERNEQDLYGYKLLAKENSDKLMQTISSSSHDPKVAAQLWDAEADLGLKLGQTQDLRIEAAQAARKVKQSKAKETGKGALSFSTSETSPALSNAVLYHELTHQLFNSLRAKVPESFDKYKTKVSGLFEGDNDDVANAVDALPGINYNSADMAYGRQYKVNSLFRSMQPLRDSSDAKEKESFEAMSKVRQQGEDLKQARAFKPFNPEINKALLDSKVDQATISRMEDNGKEEFLTTLVQNIPNLDNNLNLILESTLTDLLGSAGISRQKFAKGGAASDTVPAMLTPGEFVINKKAAQSIGYSKLNKMNHADKIQGFARGGAVGGVQMFAAGGPTLTKDQTDYLARQAASLGLSMAKYEETIRGKILDFAKLQVQQKEQAKTDISDTITANTGSINNAESGAAVEDETRKSLKEMFSKIDPDMDTSKIDAGINDIITQMKAGLSATDIANSVDALKSVLDYEVTIRKEVAATQGKMESGGTTFNGAPKILSADMKVKGVDVRADASVASGDMAQNVPNRREAQRARESKVGQAIGRAGEMNSAANLPGMASLNSSFPKLGANIEKTVEKFGGLVGVVSGGSILLSSAMPGLYKSLEGLTGQSLEASKAAAGLTGALRQGGAMGVAGSQVGKTIGAQFGNSKGGAAIGGAIGAVGGAASGYLKDSTLKENENALKRVSSGMDSLQRTLAAKDQAQTLKEKESLQKEAEESYKNLAAVTDQAADEIGGNRVWLGVSAALDGFMSGIIMATTALYAMSASSMMPSFGGLGGRGSKKKARGGRIGYLSSGGDPSSGINFQPRGTDTIPAMLTPGEFVVNKRSAAKHSMQLNAINRSRGGPVEYLAGGGPVQYLKGGTLGAIVDGVMLATMIAGPIVSAIMNFFGVQSADAARLLDLELQQLESLKNIASTGAAFKANTNQGYSDRIVARSDVIEKSNLTAPQKQARYGSLRDGGGKLNALNIEAEQARRSGLEAKGFKDIPIEKSVQEFLDSLSGSDKTRAEASVKESDTDLERKSYINSRVKTGGKTPDQAEKEYKLKKKTAGGQQEIDAVAEKEMGAFSRGKVLADKMKIIGSGVKEVTLELNDVLSRYSAAISRTTAEIDAATRKTNTIADSYAGRSTAGRASSQSVDTLSNIKGYSSQELSSVLSSVTEDMGGGKETNQAASFVKGLQIIQKDLPTILREGRNQPIDQGGVSAVDAKLRKMFEGSGIDDSTVNQMVGNIQDYLSSPEANRANGSDEEFTAENKFMKDFAEAGEVARQSLLEYAQAQQKGINEMADQSDRLSAAFGSLADNAVRSKGISAQGNIDIKERLNKKVSYEERTRSVDQSVSTLSGGLTDPNAIKNNIQGMEAQRQAMSSTPKKAKESMVSGDMSRLTAKINQSVRALDLLASNSDHASAALKKIDEAQQIASGQKRGVMDFLSKLNNPEAMIEIVAQKGAFDRVMNGGGNMQDISAGTQVMSQLESTRSPEDFAKIQSKFVDNSMNIMKNQGNPDLANVVGDFQTKLVDPAFKPEQNPEIAKFTKVFQESITAQSAAVTAQSDLLNSQGAAISSNIVSIGQSIGDSLKLSMDNIVKELNDAAARLNTTVPARASKGGLIRYYSMGSEVSSQNINWSPKGTDTVPAMLTPGEFVVNRAATQSNLPLLKSINAGQHAAGGQIKYLVRGGLVEDNFGELRRNLGGQGVKDYGAFDYLDFIGNKDNEVSDAEVQNFKQLYDKHQKDWQSVSSIERYKQLVLDDEFNERGRVARDKKRTYTQYFLGKQAKKASLSNKDIEFSRGYEAANGIAYGKRLTGGRGNEGDYFGGDKNFPFTDLARKRIHQEQQAEYSVDTAQKEQFETFAIGLLSKAIPGVLGVIGGGIGFAGGLLTSPVTGPVGPAVGAFGGAVGGSMAGEAINQAIYSYLFPDSMKKSIQAKIDKNPGAYSAGQWTGFAAEIAGGAAVAGPVANISKQLVAKSLGKKVVAEGLEQSGAKAAAKITKPKGSSGAKPVQQVVDELSDDAGKSIANNSKGVTGAKSPKPGQPKKPRSTADDVTIEVKTPEQIKALEDAKAGVKPEVKPEAPVPIRVPGTAKPNSSNFYERLGVFKDATEEEMKVAYRNLSKQLHPDMPGGDASLQKRVIEAFDALSDPKKRRIYDDAQIPGAVESAGQDALAASQKEAAKAAAAPGKAIAKAQRAAREAQKKANLAKAEALTPGPDQAARQQAYRMAQKQADEAAEKARKLVEQVNEAPSAVPDVSPPPRSAAPDVPDAPTPPRSNAPAVPDAPTPPRSNAPAVPDAPTPGAPRPGAPRPGAPRPGAPTPRAPRTGSWWQDNKPKTAWQWLRTMGSISQLVELGGLGLGALFGDSSPTETPPQLPPTTDPSADVQTPATAEEADAAKTLQDIKRLRIKRSDTTIASTDDATVWDQYKFGRNMKFQLDNNQDPLLKASFYARKVTLPKFEMGQSTEDAKPDQAKLLSQKERAELEKQLEAGEKTKTPAYYKIRKQLNDDYKLQVARGQGRSSTTGMDRPTLPKAPSLAQPTDIDGKPWDPKDHTADIEASEGPLKKKLSDLDGARGGITNSARRIKQLAEERVKSDTPPERQTKIDEEIAKEGVTRTKNAQIIDTIVGGPPGTDPNIGITTGTVRDKYRDAEAMKFVNDTQAENEKQVRTRNLQEKYKEYDRQQTQSKADLDDYIQRMQIYQDGEGKNKDATTGGTRLSSRQLTAPEKAELERQKKELEQEASGGVALTPEKLKRLEDLKNQIGLDRKYEMKKDESIDYVLFNHAQQTNPYGPFRNPGDSKTYGSPGLNTEAQATDIKTNYGKITQQLLKQYAKLYGSDGADTTNNDWMKKVDRAKLVDLPDRPISVGSLPMDVLTNQNVAAAPAEADKGTSAIAGLGLLTPTGNEDASNKMFQPLYKAAFLKKFNTLSVEKLAKQQEEQTTTDTTTLKGAMQQAEAWKNYSAQMWNGQPPLYKLPNVKGAAPKPVFGNIDLKDEAKVKAALIGEGTKDKDKALAAALRAKYLKVAVPFRKITMDDPFGGLGNKVDQQWIDKDNAIGFPGSPEELAARIHADSNALNSILSGKTDYLGGAAMTTQMSQDIHSGQAVLSANANDLKALSEEDQSLLGEKDKTGKSEGYVELLKNSLIFGKGGRYKKESRIQNFDMFKALDLQKNATAAPYVKGEALIDSSIEALKPAYNIWDSIDKYSFDPKTNTLSLKSEDIDGGQTIQTAKKGEPINIGGKTFTSGGKPEDFPNFVVGTLLPYQAQYTTLTGILQTQQRDFPASADMLATTKYGPMEDVNLAAQGGATPLSAAQATAIGTAATAHYAAIQTMEADSIVRQTEPPLIAATADILDQQLRFQPDTRIMQDIDRADSKIFMANQAHQAALSALTSQILPDNLTVDPNPAITQKLIVAEQLARIDRITSYQPYLDEIDPNQLAFASGGIVPSYFGKGGGAPTFAPRGTDTVPAMLTPGEFVINRKATQQNLPLLKSINSGGSADMLTQYASRGSVIGGPATQYASRGSIIGGPATQYLATGGMGEAAGGIIGGMMGGPVGTAIGKAMGAAFSGDLDGFIAKFKGEAAVFTTLTSGLSQAFGSFVAPVTMFGAWVTKFATKVDELKNLEIKGPNIPDKVDFNGNVTVTVANTGASNNNNSTVTLDEASMQKIVDSVSARIDKLKTLGR